MQYKNENIITMVSFLTQFLQDKQEEEILKICRRCIQNIESYMELQCIDEQFFLTSVFTACNIAFFQLDGMKNISNYVAFKHTVREQPVLLIVREKTFRKLFHKTKTTCEEKNMFLWLEQDVAEKYILHIGKKAKKISQRKLLQMYLYEKNNFHSKYFVCAVIQGMPVKT